MRTFAIRLSSFFVAAGLLGSLSASSSSEVHKHLAPIAPVAGACPRAAAGAAISDPPRLHSANGVLAVALSFQTRTDEHGRPIFCFMTPDGLQNPTLHVMPGDN